MTSVSRISWTLRPVVSIKLENWEKRRESMQDVCSNCHAAGWIGNFYKQYDNTVDLYNEKFAKPAKAIMEQLYADGKLTKTPFDEKLEWTYYELWHHQGRRARMGTAMMGPDYTQWHGFYEVAKNFYNEFLPEAEEAEPGITAESASDRFSQMAQRTQPGGDEKDPGLLQGTVQAVIDKAYLPPALRIVICHLSFVP